MPSVGGDEQFRRAVVPRGDDRQAARERFERDQRTRVVEGRVDEEVGREVAVLRVGAVAEERHAVRDAEPPRLPLVPAELRVPDDDERDVRLAARARTRSSSGASPFSR